MTKLANEEISNVTYLLINIPITNEFKEAILGFFENIEQYDPN